MLYTGDMAVAEPSAPLAALVGAPELTSGRRTTLRVPDALAAAASRLAAETGTSRNDALVRLALAGARVAERARAVAETREARWQALLRAEAPPADGYPSAEDSAAAALALRRDAVV